MSYNQQQGSQSSTMMYQLVNDSKLPNLTSNLHQEFFPITTIIPQSLTYNLISQNRVIKQIKNSHNIVGNVLRGFYYQLFKLCFEMYDPQNTKNYLQMTKNIIFDRSIIVQSNNQTHYKHIAQFINIMQNEQSQSFEEILSKYHEIDQGLTSILQQLIQQRSKIEQNQNLVELILNDLCQLFQITLIPNHPYYQFQQSDVFFFIQNQQNCYVVYNDNQQEDEGQEQLETQKSNNVSQISVSQKSKTPSQITENNLKNDGNFTKQYTFQPQFKGENQVSQNSNKTSEVSSSINSKQCNSRPVSNISYKSHISSESEYKRQQIGNRYQIKNQNKKIQNYTIHNNMPQKQSPFSLNDPFKKGTFKISNPYQLSSPSPFTKALQQIPVSQQYKNHYYSPPSPTNDIIKQKQTNLGQSHYVNNSISNYYEGYYGEIPQNTSVQSTNSKNDTIINIFGDMLKSGKYQGSYSEENIGNKPTKKHIQQTEKILQANQQLQKQDSSDLYPNFIKKINKFDPVEMMDRAKSVKSINDHNNSDFNTNSANNSKTLQYSVAERPQIKQNFINYPKQSKNYSSIVQEKNHSYVEATSSVIDKTYKPTNFDDDQGIFYKPKKSQLKIISQVTASKQSINLNKNNENQDSKGSIYRQFSDTRILKLLRQPHKTKVQIMRNRFKGQHFNL